MNTLTAALIPHEHFHKGIWLFSVNRPGWYYFLEKENKNNIENPCFFESVDPPLKELVSFLHGQGIKTTPSCSGHHKSEKKFKKIYDDLEKDKEEIRNGGIRLKDIESGKVYAYRDEQYALPWSKDEFLSKALTYQENGIVGIRVSGNIKSRLLQLYIPAVKTEEKDSIVFIRTAEDGIGISDKWKLITKEVKNIFKKQMMINQKNDISI